MEVVALGFRVWLSGGGRQNRQIAFIDHVLTILGALLLMLSVMILRSL